MILILKRSFSSTQVTGGMLSIKDSRVACTSEHTATMLKKGCYKIRIIKQSAPWNRLMPQISICGTPTSRRGLIRWGNGVCTLTDGSIIVGQRTSRDLVIHSRLIFQRLYDRLLKCQKRGEPIYLEVE